MPKLARMFPKEKSKAPASVTIRGENALLQLEANGANIVIRLTARVPIRSIWAALAAWKGELGVEESDEYSSW